MAPTSPTERRTTHFVRRFACAAAAAAAAVVVGAATFLPTAGASRTPTSRETSGIRQAVIAHAKSQHVQRALKTTRAPASRAPTVGEAAAIRQAVGKDFQLDPVTTTFDIRVSSANSHFARVSFATPNSTGRASVMWSVRGKGWTMPWHSYGGWGCSERPLLSEFPLTIADPWAVYRSVSRDLGYACRDSMDRARYAELPQHSFVLRGNTIGGFPTALDTDNSIAGALRNFGREDSAACDATGTTLSWSFGLDIRFGHLPGPKLGSCYRGTFAYALITGRRWTTAKGLRIGMARTTIRKLYPRARVQSDDGLPGEALGLLPDKNPSVQAVVRGGRITAFRIYTYGHA